MDRAMSIDEGIEMMEARVRQLLGR